MTRPEAAAKVVKLRALAARAGTEEEAVNASRQAHRIYAAYGLSEADIEAVQARPPDQEPRAHKHHQAPGDPAAAATIRVMRQRTKGLKKLVRSIERQSGLRGIWDFVEPLL